jgi:ABC-type nitrate/sulfonate/bicarbonate transport system substrate-binding protein
MNRRGASSKAPLLLLGGLLLIIGGGIALWRYWPAHDDQTAPPNTNPNGPPVVQDPGPPITPADKVKPGQAVQVPFIFWGGDVATFVANGGLDAQKDSILGRQDLNVKLTKGDDFEQQVKDYLDNKSPFLRGTLSMLGQASDRLTARPETTPVVFLQLTWSGGDHFVGRANFKTLNDIKGKKIAIQKGGPHVGMLNDILRTARVGWNEIKVVWTEDVTGEKGPAEKFRKDQSIDACFAISPDMTDLTGGLESTGTGQKNSVDGAHVVVSTAYMSHSIADVYACRRDFYEGNKEWVEKFAAAYIKGCEDLVDAKKKSAPAYKAAIKLAQDIWGKYDDLKDSVAKEDDVDGLISDSTFVGLPGNVSFFTAKGNLTGFAFKLGQALQLPDDPATQPFKTNPKGFRRADFDYDALAKLGGLNGKPITQARFEPEIKIEPEKTIYSFNILFQPDQDKFSEQDYGGDFQRALEEASLFGNAVVAIRGHADPTLFMQRFLNAATRQGLLKPAGPRNSYKTADGKPFDLNNITNVLDIVAKNPTLHFVDANGDGDLMTNAEASLQSLSDKRAARVREAILNYARSKGLVLEASQMRSEGVGVKEPVIAFPQTDDQAAQNRRVEFSIIKVPAEKVHSDEFGL